jgi:putative phage-type endonuclease
MLQYKHFKNREEWLIGRNEGIGASEAAAIVGASNWMTSTELWEVKTGRRKPKDMSDNELVHYGTEAEKYIRALFRLKHEELEMKYHPYDILFQDYRPWLRCTLDGELTTEDGERGILECKVHFVRGKSDLAQWNNRIPDHYLIQILHQWLASEFTFAYLTAEIIFQDFDSQLRTYYFKAENYQEEMDWLLAEEEKFWESVKSGNSPPAKLIL